MKNHRPLIEFFYFLKGRKDLKFFDEFQSKYNAPIHLLEDEQLKQFKVLFEFSKNNIPYYSQLFSSLKLKVDDFKSLKDLEKIPVLTKSQITSNHSLFFPKHLKRNYVNGSTGGSTGKPLKYRIDVEDYSRNFALLYRGFTRAGYKIGDKMAIIAGGSLVNQKFGFKQKLQNYVLNYKKLSSYGLDDNILRDYYYNLSEWQPSFLRGYASSLFLFSRFISENNLPVLKLKGIFSTGEVLTLKQRIFMEDLFKVKVFDNYGLNDGGITAFEDNTHSGFVIDTERSILEVVNESGENVFNENGKIIATSLYNYSMPFIRYDTGDFGTQVKSDKSPCTRHRLISLGGRSTDFIEYNNRIIGSPVLTVLMGKLNVNRYQIIQKKDGSIEFRIDVGDNFSSHEENFIKKSFIDNMGSDENLKFIYTNHFINSENKHKFIIKE